VTRPTLIGFSEIRLAIGLENLADFAGGLRL